LAIVATDVGGNREALEGGRFGTMVPPRQPDVLATAIRATVDHIEFWKGRGAEAAMSVRAKYSAQNLAESFLAIYMSRQRNR
jgi:glycosyltransferase involved in cell wall biosynthesis